MNEVRALRTGAGLTQDGLAELSGVAQPNIAAYESGRRKPSRAMLDRLREAAKSRPSMVLSRNRNAVLDCIAEHRATNPRVFGSVARGEDGAHSDVDLLVRLDENADLFDLSDLIADLEDLLHVRVDVVSEAGLRPGPNAIRDEARPL